MNQITGLTDSASQVANLSLPDGSNVQMTISFRPQQSGWFYDLVWTNGGATWQALGRRLVTGPNVLRQFSNVISFGLMVSSTDGGEPIFQEDFESGRITLYLLNSDDVAQVETSLMPVFGSIIGGVSFYPGPPQPWQQGLEEVV